MKKKLKIFLLIVIIILLIVAGTLLYIFKFKEYDVADAEVEQIIEDPYAIELPDGTTITLDENGEVVDTANADAKKTTADSGGTASAIEETGTSPDGTSTNGDKSKVEGTTAGDKGANSTSGSTNTTDAGKKATVGSIKQKYIPTLENLQSQADSKLNTLVSHAKKEYSDKKANGESVSYGYFYNKYVGAANGLEARTDAVFAGVISAVEKDLVANGYDKSYAKSLIEDYNAKKKARKDSLLSKVVGL